MNDMTSIAEPNTLVEVPITPVSRVTREDLADAVRATALLADLTISLWTGERTDRTLSDQIKADAGAVGNTGRYLKNLMAGCDNELKSVRGAYQAARTAHYQLTLPWVSHPNSERQTGPRLLPNLLFSRYLDQMSRLKLNAESRMATFVAEYPDLILRAQANLAGLANAADYPSPQEVQNSFKLVFDFLPIPAASSFSGLPDAMLEKLGKQLTRRQENAARISRTAMWERVRTTVGHLVDRLADPDTAFKASSVESVREMVTLLPGWNCTGDDKVTTVVSDIQTMLNGLDAKGIRRDKSARADVARKAQAIADKLDQWRL